MRCFRLLLLSLALALITSSASVAAVPNGTSDLALRAVLERGDFVAAGQILRKRLAVDSSRALDWFNLGNVQFSLKEYPAAIGSYRKVVALASPLSKVARLYIAKCYRFSDQLPESASALAEATSQTLSPKLAVEAAEEKRLLLERALEVAHRQYEEGEYAPALALLRLFPETDLPPAGLFLQALAASSSGLDGESEKAAELLKKVIESQASSPRLKGDSKELLDVLTADPGADRIRVKPVLELSYGFNTNVYAAGGSESQLARPALLFVGALRVPVSAPVFLLDLSFRLEDVPSLPTERFFSPSLQGRFAKGWPSGWLLEASLGGTYQIVGKYAFLARPGLQLELTRTRGKGSWGFRAEHTRNLPLDNDFTYLQGSSTSASFKAGRSVGFGYVGGTVGYGSEINRDFRSAGNVLPLAFKAITVGIDLRFKPVREWDLSLQPQYSRRYYPTLAEPDGVEREDEALETSFRLTRALTGSVSALIQGLWLVNQSVLGPGSVADKNFQVFRGYAGLSVSW